MSSFYKQQTIDACLHGIRHANTRCRDIRMLLTTVTQFPTALPAPGFQEGGFFSSNFHGVGKDIFHTDSLTHLSSRRMRARSLAVLDKVDEEIYMENGTCYVREKLFVTSRDGSVCVRRCFSLRRDTAKRCALFLWQSLLQTLRGQDLSNFPIPLLCHLHPNKSFEVSGVVDA
jgi:hypothetical protein